MYIELHCHSCFSLLDGASRPEALVARAAELEMPALALTDHDALYGAVPFWRAAQAAGIKPIFGAEITVEEEGEERKDGNRGKRERGEGEQSSAEPGAHLTLLAENQTGYANLSRLITTARGRSRKGAALATWDDLAAHSTGLIVLSGCRRGAISHHLAAGRFDAAVQTAFRLQDLFGVRNFFIELQQQRRPGDLRLAQQLTALATKHKFPVVATNNVHYATRASHRLHDVLVAIRYLTTLEASHHQRRGNSEAYLKSAGEMMALFVNQPDAIMRTVEIAARCQVDLQHGVQPLPLFPVPSAAGEEVSHASVAPDLEHALTPPDQQLAYLRWLCGQAMIQRYGGARGLDTAQAPFGNHPAGTRPAERAWQMLDHELAVINRLGLANYFLIVWDIMRFARSQGIRCQGRGSAANSLVAYLLGITPIDPLAHDLVFERFLSEERPHLPDIDIDFDALRREEVIQYVYTRYGRDHAAMACTFVTFQQRSAIRNVGRALGYPPELLDALASAADRINLEDAWRDLATALDRSPPPASHSPGFLLDLCAQIHGLPRHLGIHNGGMVLSGPPLAEIMPLEPATMAERTVCQWDKEALEDAGLVKIDLLGLRMLSALEEACDVVEETTGQRPALDRLTYDDPAVYEMLCRGDTIGCFQVESRAQAQLVPQFQPRCFADLIVEISLIRPGPIQGNMVQPYLQRRKGQQPVTYLHPLLEPALAETLGVIVFQEQVLKVARDLAGFTGGQGELLRRALGRKNAEGEMERLHAAFLAGAAAKGVPAELAATSFTQLRAFGGYAFAKSHAASFAVIVYQSAWLKRYHPLAFYIGLLRCQPMGFYSPAVLINDAQRRGIWVLPIDVNRSGVSYQAEDGAIRIGLSTVKGLGQTGAERIVLARSKNLSSCGRSPDRATSERARSGDRLEQKGVRPERREDRPGREEEFASLADFCCRTRLPRLLVENLIQAGALDSLSMANDQQSIANGQRGSGRRELLWQLGVLDYQEDTLLSGQEPAPAPAELPRLQPLEALAAELQMTGVSAGQHVMAHHRVRLAEQGVLSSRDLAHCRGGELVWVAGQVTVIQSPPTAKGFWFLTLEDEFDMINVIIRPDVATRYRRVWRGSPLLAVWGRVQREGAVVNVLAQQPSRLTTAETAEPFRA
jgi:error-prone DNA polymerase